MQHSNQDEISSHAFADWLSAGRPTFCGTDGGMKDDLGTFGFAWASSGANKQQFGQGKGRVPGTYLIMSSTRAELGGVFAALTYLRLIIAYYKVKLPYAFAVTLFCNSQAGLGQLKQINTNIALT
jgi:hypothetical protein